VSGGKESNNLLLARRATTSYWSGKQQPLIGQESSSGLSSLDVNIHILTLINLENTVLSSFHLYVVNDRAEGVNYLDTKAKCRHLKKLTRKGTLRQVLIRVYRLEIRSVMLEFSAQLCQLWPLSASLWFNSSLLPCVDKYTCIHLYIV
jgi:hypothetical protein